MSQPRGVYELRIIKEKTKIRLQVILHLLFFLTILHGYQSLHDIIILKLTRKEYLISNFEYRPLRSVTVFQ